MPVTSILVYIGRNKWSYCRGDHGYGAKGSGAIERVKRKIATMIDMSPIRSLTSLHQQNPYQIPTLSAKPMQFLHCNPRRIIVQLATHAV